MIYDEPIKILCVDDERNVLRALQRAFLDDDFELLLASTGEEGLEILRNEAPVQIVLSDYRMPGMNGVDFLKEVCTGWPETVRIVLSGYADTASIVEAINEGEIYKFIPKPWNDDELRITINNALERYFLRKRNQKLTEELKARNEELERLNRDLERLVEERTSELRFQNAVLQKAHNILDALPVGVIGIDEDGLIVQANRMAVEILSDNAPSLLGLSAGDVLPEEVSEILKTLDKDERIVMNVNMQERDYAFRGRKMKAIEGQEGIVFVLIPEREGDNL